MNDLEQARQQINRVDREIALLFTQRMEAARTIAAYKKAHALPIFDRNREQALIEQNCLCIEDPQLRSFYIPFQKKVMEVSRAYQHHLLSGTRVAYSGVEGAFAYIAAGRIFPDGELVSCPDFESAYQAVENGACDCAVLPLENSYAGEVGQVMDMAFRGSLYVSGVYSLKVAQNLLGLPGAAPDRIRRVLSHPQALSQCRDYIHAHGYEAVTAVNTAVAAKEVAKSGDPTLAAIASRETAKLYGLAVLDHDINESDQNSTRFAVFTRLPAETKAGDTFLLCFTVKHQAGALAEAIQIIGRYGYNMTSLRIRPMKETAFHYYFYIEAEGTLETDRGQEMLEELAQRCERLKIVGSYAEETELKDALL